MKTFVAQTADQWRKWLDEHHDSESEVWLIFYKLHTGVGSIAYLDALDEALCFGWVDSLVKRLDESRYARKFTPRKADSRWSTINRKRYAALKATGRLKPSGINRAPTDRSYGSATATVPNARHGSTVHSGSTKETAGGMAVLRGAGALTSATVYRLDRIRQARGDKGQTSEGGDSPPCCRQTAGTQLNSRPTN